MPTVAGDLLEMMMRFYPSKNNNKLNRRMYLPEGITGCVMVNPHYRVDLASGTRYIIDSGAFQERDMRVRLTPAKALERQLRLEAQIEYGTCNMPAEAIITYDMLDGVDEALDNDGRVKERGTDETASGAVLETIRSARYYASQRDELQGDGKPLIRGAIAYACQGVSTEQYVACAREIIPLIRPGRDWFAFGGLCITGIMRGQMLPVFTATLSAVVPLLRDAGITRAHLLGVCLPEAVRVVRELEKTYKVAFSTDSRAPETAGCIYGRVYHDVDGVLDGRQRDCYTREQKWIDYHPNTLAHDNVRDYHQWMETL